MNQNTINRRSFISRSTAATAAFGLNVGNVFSQSPHSPAYTKDPTVKYPVVIFHEGSSKAPDPPKPRYGTERSAPYETTIIIGSNYNTHPDIRGYVQSWGSTDPDSFPRWDGVEATEWSGNAKLYKILKETKGGNPYYAMLGFFGFAKRRFWVRIAQQLSLKPEGEGSKFTKEIAQLIGTTVDSSNSTTTNKTWSRSTGTSVSYGGGASIKGVGGNIQKSEDEAFGNTHGFSSTKSTSESFSEVRTITDKIEYQRSKTQTMDFATWQQVEELKCYNIGFVSTKPINPDTAPIYFEEGFDSKDYPFNEDTFIVLGEGLTGYQTITNWGDTLQETSAPSPA